MSYLALYRRYRPSGFDGLIGQEHIVKTLVNQIKTDRVGHAYLFCGARGTGKTSAAKIFARAINCLSPVNGSPCGKCEVCKALSDGANLDILEMDAASNNKVENVREIRDKIQYPPVAGRYKVYIIDEVHMLTTEAFNALLKTLEEPPAHAVFILATTEVHKLPSTILSRCMRFDFRLIPTKKIAELIAGIYDENGKEYDREAITAIAAAGAGSIRDALSVADICISYGEGKLTYRDVLEVLGATDIDVINKLIEGLFDSDTGKILEITERLCESGKSVGVLCRDIITTLRQIIIAKTCAGAREILELPEENFAKLKAIGDNADEHRLLRAVEIFSKAEGDLRYSASSRAVLETACIKASLPETDYDIDALISRVAALEKRISELSAMPQKADNRLIEGDIKRERKKETDYTVENEAREVRAERTESDFSDFGEPEAPPEDSSDYGAAAFTPNYSEKKVSAEPKPQAQTASGGASAGRLWGTVIRNLRASGNIVLWVACQDMRAELEGKTLKIIASDKGGYSAITKENNLSALSKAVKALGDYDIEVLMEGEVKDGFSADAEKVKRTFGEDKVKIKD